MSKEKAEALNLEPLATVVSSASAGVDPQIMGTGPIPATKKALEKANLTIDDLDLIESNEAFASEAICVNKELGFNPEIVNVNGGAIARSSYWSKWCTNHYYTHSRNEKT